MTCDSSMVLEDCGWMQVPLNIFAVNVQQKKVMIFLTLIFKSEIYLTVCISALRSRRIWH